MLSQFKPDHSHMKTRVSLLEKIKNISTSKLKEHVDQIENLRLINTHGRARFEKWFMSCGRPLTGYMAL